MKRLSMVCLSGPDGVGKTTQANRLTVSLAARGFNVKYSWLRSSHFFMLPILVYLRMFGFTKILQTTNGCRASQVDVSGRKYLGTLICVATMADMMLGSIAKIHLPRAFGRTVICDRYVFDAVVDLAILMRDHEFPRSGLGKIFYRLIPNDALCLIIIASPLDLRSRRSDIAIDITLEERVRIYSDIAEEQGAPCIDATNMSTKELHERILKEMGA